MSGVNLCIIMGRLTRDPEIKTINGMTIANFAIATSKNWTDESGEKKEKAEFHNCVAFKKTADFVGKYFTKGKSIYIQGELQTKSWEDKETKKKVYRTEIVAQNVQFAGDSKGAAAEPISGIASTPPPVDSEIPF